VKDIFKNAIVLTGGIATGKSTAAALFKEHGLAIIDADKIAHDILDANSHNIAKLFGNEYVNDHKVIRKKLGVLVFNKPDKKKQLENFIHPLIHNRIKCESQKLEMLNKRYLVDIPLFFETKNYDIDKSIVVYTNRELQCQRLMNRDQCDIQSAKLRIDSQIDIEEKRKLASYIIENTKDKQYLKEEVLRVLKDIR